MERFCKVAILFLLAPALALSQWQIGQRSFYVPSGGPVTPVADHRWQVNYASNTCGTGVACTNGAGVNTLVDFGTVAGSSVSNATTAQQPIYTTSAINSLAAAGFTAASSQHLETGGASQVQGTSYSGYAVFKIASATNSAIIGNNLGGSTDVEWRINSSQHQELLNEGFSSICTGTATFSVGTWYAVAFTYDSGTGVCTLYTISGGTYTSDGTATNARTVTGGVADIGMGASAEYFDGTIAEVGLSTSIWSAANLTTNATYIHSEYGL